MDGRLAGGLVFVVGCPRSGTSALAWALAEHPAFAGGPESNILWPLFQHGGPRLAWDVAYRGRTDSWCVVHKVRQEEFAAAVGAGLERLFASRSGGRRWVVDSSPENVLIAEDLAFIFPTARFVHLVRDGRAVVASMLRSGFAEPWAWSFEEACRTWVHFVTAGLKAQQALGERMCSVVHQRLVEDPRGACAHLLAFLGEPDHPGPAAFLQTRRVNSSYDAASPEDMKRPRDPKRLRERPWLAWPAEWHERFHAIAGPTAAVVARLACHPARPRGDAD